MRSGLDGNPLYMVAYSQLYMIKKTGWLPPVEASGAYKSTL